MEEDLIMTSNPLFYQLLLAALVLLCIIIHAWWPDPLRGTPPPPIQPDPPRRQRSKEPKPFAGQNIAHLSPLHKRFYPAVF
jgi:hypothetical protein